MEADTLDKYLVEHYGSTVTFVGTDSLTDKRIAYIVDGDIHVGWDVQRTLDYSFDMWWQSCIDFDSYVPEGLEMFDVQLLSRDRDEELVQPEFDIDQYLQSITVKYIDI